MSESCQIRSRCCLVTKSCPTLYNPMDYSLPDSSVHRISQTRYWSGSPFPSPGDLPHPGIEPTSPALAGSSLPLSHQGGPNVASIKTQKDRFWRMSSLVSTWEFGHIQEPLVPSPVSCPGHSFHLPIPELHPFIIIQ